MNELTTTKTQLPAHLAHLATNTALMGINAAASAGVSGGSWPRISLKTSRFRLQHPQGDEVVVPSLDLEVIIVDANPNGLSKTFYVGAYDPSVEEKAPDCYSDNVVGPSSRAAKPQCGTCAACPNNIWGSKINPSGAQGKLCGDSKKVAVLIADNPDGPVFELRVPAASLKNLANYIEGLNNRGIPAAAVVTKLSFDTSADYPKLVFAPSGWASVEQIKAVEEVIGTEEVDQCTGKNDKPADAKKALPAPVSAASIAQPMAMPPMPPAQQAMPLPPMPTAPQAVPLPPAPMVGNVQDSPGGAGAPAKRTRKPKDAGFVAAAPAPADNTPPPPLLRDSPLPPVIMPSAAATAAPLAAAPTNAALDDLIAKALAV